MSKASRTKPPTRISDTRLAMVIVKRSLEAAKAIIAGNSVNLITSVNMASAYPFTGLTGRLAERNARNEKAPARDRSPLVTE